MPELTTRTRPEPRCVCCQRALKTLTIHVSERQDLARLRILHDCGNQAVLIELQVFDSKIHTKDSLVRLLMHQFEVCCAMCRLLFDRLQRTTTPRCRKYSLTVPIVN